jgi:hypothetical protein
MRKYSKMIFAYELAPGHHVFECPDGHHVYSKVSDSIKTCYECKPSQTKKRNILDYCIIGSDKGGAYLGQKDENGEYTATAPNSATEKSGWFRCKHGHEFTATYNNVKRGTWCPYCSNHSSVRKTLDDYNRVPNGRGEFVGVVIDGNIVRECPQKVSVVCVW